MKAPDSISERLQAKLREGTRLLAEACLKHVKQTRTAIDAGAHIGAFAMNLGAFENVVCYEPIAQNLPYLRENAPDALIEPVALSASNGLVHLGVNDFSAGQIYHPHNLVEVETRTLDSYLPKEVDLLKINCDGMDHQVLEGAIITIVVWRPVIAVETKVVGELVNRQLQQLGYRFASTHRASEIWLP